MEKFSVVANYLVVRKYMFYSACTMLYNVAKVEVILLSAFLKMITLFVVFFLLCIGTVRVWDIYFERTGPVPFVKTTPEKFTPSDPDFVGPVEFRADMEKALLLIKSTVPDSYENVRKYIRSVRTIEVSSKPNAGARVNTELGVVFIPMVNYEILLKETEKHPEYLHPILASTLIHETQHMIQRHQKRQISEEEKESEALAAERGFLYALKIHPLIIESIAGVDKLKSRWWEAPTSKEVHGF
jgi:hypothetical protein